MEFLNELYFYLISLVCMGFFIYFWVLVFDVLKKLKKFLDLKIIEMEVEYDKDKF